MLRRRCLSFAASRAAAVAGSYEAMNPADVWPGDVLALTSEWPDDERGRAAGSTVPDGMALPEVLTYRIEFANDWAEGLGLKLSEAIAADALLPQTALNAPGNVLANLQQLQVVSATGTALQVDAGMAPPAGGGFEVRRRDWDLGRAWIRTWCCGVRYGAFRFRAKGRWSSTTCGCTTDRRRRCIRDFRAQYLRIFR